MVALRFGTHLLLFVFLYRESSALPTGILPVSGRSEVASGPDQWRALSLSTQSQLSSLPPSGIHSPSTVTTKLKNDQHNYAIGQTSSAMYPTLPISSHVVTPHNAWSTSPSSSRYEDRPALQSGDLPASSSSGRFRLFGQDLQVPPPSTHETDRRSSHSMDFSSQASGSSRLTNPPPNEGHDPPLRPSDRGPAFVTYLREKGLAFANMDVVPGSTMPPPPLPNSPHPTTHVTEPTTSKKKPLKLFGMDLNDEVARSKSASADAAHKHSQPTLPPSRSDQSGITGAQDMVIDTQRTEQPDQTSKEVTPPQELQSEDLRIAEQTPSNIASSSQADAHINASMDKGKRPMEPVQIPSAEELPPDELIMPSSPPASGAPRPKRKRKDKAKTKTKVSEKGKKKRMQEPENIIVQKKTRSKLEPIDKSLLASFPVRVYNLVTGKAEKYNADLHGFGPVTSHQDNEHRLNNEINRRIERGVMTQALKYRSLFVRKKMRHAHRKMLSQEQGVLYHQNRKLLFFHRTTDPSIAFQKFQDGEAYAFRHRADGLASLKKPRNNQNRLRMLKQAALSQAGDVARLPRRRGRPRKDTVIAATDSPIAGYETSSEEDSEEELNPLPPLPPAESSLVSAPAVAIDHQQLPSFPAHDFASLHHTIQPLQTSFLSDGITIPSKKRSRRKPRTIQQTEAKE